jgi:hypothetical protein
MNPVPLMVKGCGEFEPVTGLGTTLLIVGATASVVKLWMLPLLVPALLDA